MLHRVGAGQSRRGVPYVISYVDGIAFEEVDRTTTMKCSKLCSGQSTTFDLSLNC